jgi:hypothetical protein
LRLWAPLFAAAVLGLCAIITQRVCVFLDSTTQLVAASTAVVERLPAQMEAIRMDASSQISATRSELAFQADKAQHLGTERSKEALAILDRHIGQTVRVLDMHTGELTNSVDRLRTDIRPVLANAAALTKDAQDTMDALYPDVLAATGSITVAATQTAQAAQEVQRAMPKFLATAQSMGDNSNATTAYSAALLKNLVVSSKPLPVWARIGLVVAPAVTQTGFTIASWKAIRGN